MKTSEAKEKVCPFMSINGIDRNGIAYVVKSKCICEECMAWKINYQSKAKVNIDGTKTYTDGYCSRLGNE